MALLNKIFFSKLKSSQASSTSKSDSCLVDKNCNKQRSDRSQTITNRNTVHINTKNDSCGKYTGPSNIRIVLFRECDIRGRRLLFDSSGGQLKTDVEDMQLIEDMAFGSANLKYFGDNYRLHDFGTVLWQGYYLMVTKVFFVPPSQVKSNNTSSIASIANSSSGLNKVCSTATDSGFTEYEASNVLSSCNSLATGPSSSNSWVNFSATSLGVHRITSRNAISDSLLSKDREAKIPKGKKVRLAVVLLFSPDDEFNQVPLRDLLFGESSLMEHIFYRLQLNILRAYNSRNHFFTLINDAVNQLEKDLLNICSSYLENPAYLELVPADQAEMEAARKFMDSWEWIVREMDTKLTRFFWSTVLTATLTYHINWMFSFIGQNTDLLECGNRILILSKNKSLAQHLIYVLSYFVRDKIITGIRFIAENKIKVNPPDVKNDNLLDRSCSNYLSKSLDHLSDECCSSDRPFNRDSTNIESSVSQRRSGTSRRSSQLLENNRYLRNYYDVRFQMSPDTVAKKDGQSFANVKYTIVKSDFQDYSFRDKPLDDNLPSRSDTIPCSFFVGSIPERSPNESEHSRYSTSSSISANSHPIEIPLLSACTKPQKSEGALISSWVYADGLTHEYQAGRLIQCCDPSYNDWLRDLQRDLQAAVLQLKTVSCIVANTETWEIKVLTYVEEESCPLRIKEMWVPVPMSGLVAALVESTQLLWLMEHDVRQCLRHIEDRLRFLCQKSSELGTLLSSSVCSWNVEHITHLLGIETQDLPLLMAGCCVHNPSIARMGGVTLL